MQLRYIFNTHPLLSLRETLPPLLQERREVLRSRTGGEYIISTFSIKKNNETQL